MVGATKLYWRSPDRIGRLLVRIVLGVVMVAVVLGWAVQGRSLPLISVPVMMAQVDPNAPVDDLRQQQETIDQQREDLQSQQEQLQNLEDAAQDRLGGLQNTIQDTSERIQYNEEQLKLATERLAQLQSALAIAESRYQERQFATVARLRFLQRQQDHQGWAILLNSRNINDFLDRRYQLKRVYDSDRGILANLKEEADELQQRRRTVEAQKNDIALLTQELLAQKSDYEAQASEQTQLIDRLRQDRNALEEAEDRLAQDSANLTVLIQQRLSGGSSPGAVLGTGQFVYPVDGPVTSTFGWRVHPILGYERFHSGLDFGVDYGTTIRAADSGVVIFADWYGGYGLAVIIDHGGGLTTLYGHCSELYVAQGQGVSPGQAIAASGSTGLSTGPHLHFEVRQDGEPVDPASYL
jgi:murein DD-endopeptidase MepM/ murein hydrolase activator NlpD